MINNGYFVAHYILQANHSERSLPLKHSISEEKSIHPQLILRLTSGNFPMALKSPYNALSTLLSFLNYADSCMPMDDCILVMHGSFILVPDSKETLLNRNTSKITYYNFIIDPNKLLYFHWYPDAFFLL